MRRLWVQTSPGAFYYLRSKFENTWVFYKLGSQVRMAEWSKAPDSSQRTSVKQSLWEFWSTNVGVGSNPTPDRDFFSKKNFLSEFFFSKNKIYALAGNRTPINCLEGNYADHYTTNAHVVHSLSCFIKNTKSRNIVFKNDSASAGNRTPINCLEGNYANHYTTDACATTPF